MGILKTYKSRSGETAMQMMCDGLVLYGAVFRLNSSVWHSVCSTKDLDHKITGDEITTLLESFDQLEFDLENSAFALSSV